MLLHVFIDHFHFHTQRSCVRGDQMMCYVAVNSSEWESAMNVLVHRCAIGWKMLRLNAIVIKTSNLKQRHSFASDTTTERSFHAIVHTCVLVCWRAGVSGIFF